MATTCTSCGCNKISCGCKDSFLTSPAPCPTPADCPDPQPCSESFDSLCIIYTAPNILCGVDIVVAQDLPVQRALQNIVEYFCDKLFVTEDLSCNSNVIIPADTPVSEAISLLLDFVCDNLGTDSYVQNVALSGTDLNFTGLGLAFNGTVDLSSISGIVAADNGLTLAPGNTVQLGGTLIQDTTVTTVDYDFIFTGNRPVLTDYTLVVSNIGLGGGIRATSNTGIAVNGESVSYPGGQFSSVNFNALVATTATASSSAAYFTNIGNISNPTPIVLLLATQTAQPLPSNGISAGMRFQMDSNALGVKTIATANEIISTFVDVASGTLRSDLKFTGRAVGSSPATLVTFKGTGQVRMHNYGVGTFLNPSYTYFLGVDALGNIVEIASPL